jgi:hypothetical protein
MNRLNTEKRAAGIRALVEGNSIRATARLTSTAKATVLKLLVEVGEFCSVYQDHVLRGLNTKRVEADELWAYVGAKQKNATKDGQGDLWTYTAIDADSKLMISWLVGSRNHANTQAFMLDLSERLAGTFGLPLDETGTHRRYSPMECTGAVKLPITRLTHGFSKKAANHAHAVSLYFMFYNFCRPHQTLTKANRGIKQTPAMATGLTDHVWSVEEILSKMDSKTLLHSN